MEWKIQVGTILPSLRGFLLGIRNWNIHAKIMSHHIAIKFLSHLSTMFVLPRDFHKLHSLLSQLLGFTFQNCLSFLHQMLWFISGKHGTHHGFPLDLVVAPTCMLDHQSAPSPQVDQCWSPSKMRLSTLLSLPPQRSLVIAFDQYTSFSFHVIHLNRHELSSPYAR